MSVLVEIPLTSGAGKSSTASAGAQHGRPGEQLAAWCSSTNLVALASSGNNVSIYNPCSPEDYCNLQLDGVSTSSGSSEQVDVLQSLSWSPHRSRRALLTATRAGKLVVWTQTPNDVPGVAHVPTINQWYGQELPNAIQEEQQQDQVDSMLADDGPGSASWDRSVPLQVVHACFLSPPSPRHWSTQALMNSNMPANNLDALFLSPQPALTAPHHRHWLKAGQLILAVIDSRAGVRFYWGTLGRHPNQFCWQSSERYHLLASSGNPDGPKPLITHASCCASRNGGLHVALLDQSGQIYICTTSNDPTVQPSDPAQMNNFPHHLRFRSSLTVQIDVMHAAAGYELAAASLLLLPSCTGSMLAVLAGGAMQSISSTAGEKDSSHVLTYKESVHMVQDPMQPIGSGMQQSIWSELPTDTYMSCGSPVSSSLSASKDNSKIAFVSQSTLYVLSTEGLTLLEEKDVVLPGDGQSHSNAVDAGNANGNSLEYAIAGTPMGSMGSGNNSGGSNGNATFATAISPAGCAVCVTGFATQHDSGDASQVKDQDSDLDKLTGIMQIYACSDLPMFPGGNRSAVYSRSPNSTCDDLKSADVKITNALSDSIAEQHAKLAAARMVWCMLEMLPSWCISQRCRAYSRGGLGWAHTFRALALLDNMLHEEDSHPRPGYCHAADKLKLSLLRNMTGLIPASITVDLVTRQMVTNLQQVMMVAEKAADTGVPNAKALPPQEAVAIKPWLSWFVELTQLILASLRAWSHARSGISTDNAASGNANSIKALPGDITPGNTTDQEVWQAAAKVAEEEGPGTAWAAVQEVHEAGGPLTVDQAAAALPFVRLVMDRRFWTTMRYCVHYWSVLYKAIQAARIEPEDTAEDAVAAKHQVQLSMKHMLELATAVMMFGTPAREAGASSQQQPQQQPPQPDAEQLQAIQASLFPGHLQVHAGRPTCISTWEQLQPMLTAPGILNAAALTPRQILARARKLGLLLAPDSSDPQLSQKRLATMNSSRSNSSSVLDVWHSFRCSSVGLSGAGQEAIGLITSGLPALQPLQQGLAGVDVVTANTNVKDIASSMAAIGTAGGSTQQEELSTKRRRWYHQRAACLIGSSNPAANLERDSQAAGDTRWNPLHTNSRSTLGALQEDLPLLDVLSGRPIHPRVSPMKTFSVEAADCTGGVTCVLEDAALQGTAAAQTAQSTSLLRRAYISQCPVTGAPWKRLRVQTEDDTSAGQVVPVW